MTRMLLERRLGFALVKTPDRCLRIALLTYRGNPYSGGQGVYVRYLSKALAELGHDVTVFGGQPYPDLDDGIPFVPLPSLDLYRNDDPFRTPGLHEFRDRIDVLEYVTMCVAGYPEPRTFSLRAARALATAPPRFDVVHDNQSLGSGLLRMQKAGLPVVATVHHPCSIDRDLEIAQAPNRRRKLGLRRWYGFTRMQARVARRLPKLIAVSQIARDDVVGQFGVARERIEVVHNGVDTGLFKPSVNDDSIPGRIVTTASADVPLKGLIFLVEALAKLRTERDASLVVVGRARHDGPVRRAIERFGVSEAVTFETEIAWSRLVDLYRHAEVAVVPSLYEGFSLPAAEAMATGTPLVATNAGALPEVAGVDGETAVLVPPGDAEALAAAIRGLLADAALRRRIGAAARRRVLDRFTWRATAEATVAQYRIVIG